MINPRADDGKQAFGPYQIVNMATSEVIAELDTEYIQLPFYSYDGRLVFDWGGPIFSADDGHLVLEGDDWVSVRVMPDGQTISIVDVDGTLWQARLDDLKAGKSLPEAAIWSAFATSGLVVEPGHVASPDGRFVATTSRSNEPVTVWDASDGSPVASLDPNLVAGIPYIFFHPDDPYVTLLGEGGILLTYTLDTDQLVEIARERVTRSLSDTECQTFLHLDTCPLRGDA